MPVWRASSSPTINSDVMAAATEAMTIADMCFGAKEERITSSAKSIPAIGALKDAPMAAPAPAATSDLTSSSPSLKLLDTHEPTAAPICTIGPSRPAEPPDPIVTAVANIFSGMTRFLIRPP